MITKRALSLLAIVAATPALAGGASQLERSAGVPAGVYTLAELTQIVSAEEAREAQRLKRHLGMSQPDVARTSFAPYAAPAGKRGNQSSDR